MAENQIQSNDDSSKYKKSFKAKSNGVPTSYSTNLKYGPGEPLNLLNTFESFINEFHEFKSDSSRKEGKSMDTSDAWSFDPSLQEFDISDIDYTERECTSKSPILQAEFVTNRKLALSPKHIPNTMPKIFPQSKPKSFSNDWKGLLNFPNSDSDSSHERTKEIYKGVYPEIFDVSPQTYSAFLLENLRTWSHEVSLEEFYNMLYNHNAACVNLGRSSNQEFKRHSLEICSFILETFRYSCNGVASLKLGYIQNPSLYSVNFEEFVRNFLALKIIYDSIKQVDQSVSPFATISRKSIYEAYRTTCKKLAETSKMNSSQSNKHSNHIVGHPQFGRLMKLVYPDLKVRRFGRRGDSKYYYLGITWHNSIFQSQISPKISKVFWKQNNLLKTPTKAYFQKHVVFKSENSNIAKSEISPQEKSHLLQDFQGISNTLYSFVHVSSKFPEFDCSPRVWNFIPGKLPLQSSWSEKTMYRSVTALKKYNVDVKPILQTLHLQIFLPDSNSCFTVFFQLLNILIKGESDPKGYMHFYLVMIFLIFPLIITSDEEVSIEEKQKLQNNLIWFSEKLRTTAHTLPHREQSHFLNFSSIIRKMVHLNKLTSSQIKKSLIKGITEEIADDFQKKVSSEFDIHEKTVAEDIITKAVIVSSKAFRNVFTVDETHDNFIDQNDLTTNVIKSILKFAVVGKENLLNISNSLGSQDSDFTTCDLPFQLFRNSAQIFHNICLSDPIVLKLPIQVINCISLFIHNEMHRVSFDNFRKRDHELSKNTFKTWWVQSTIAQEYMQILSEVVGLSEQLWL